MTNLKKIERVPFSILAKPATDCPFYVGYGGKTPRADGLAWKKHERYCIARKTVALFYVFGEQRLLMGCCNRFGVRLPRMDSERLFAVAGRKMELAKNRKTVGRIKNEA